MAQNDNSNDINTPERWAFFFYIPGSRSNLSQPQMLLGVTYLGGSGAIMPIKPWLLPDQSQASARSGGSDPAYFPHAFAHMHMNARMRARTHTHTHAPHTQRNTSSGIINSRKILHFENVEGCRSHWRNFYYVSEVT